MQLFRNTVLICAFVAAAVITLVQFLHRDAAPSMSAGRYRGAERSTPS